MKAPTIALDRHVTLASEDVAVALSGSTEDLTRVLAYLSGWGQPPVPSDVLRGFSATVEAHAGRASIRVPLPAPHGKALIEWLRCRAEHAALDGDRELARTLHRVAGSGDTGREALRVEAG